MERGQTDVGHFLFAKNEALIGRGVVRLRDISSGHRGSRCTTEQRKPQSGRTQHRHGGGLCCAFLPRSLLDPSRRRSSVLVTHLAWEVCARRKGRARFTSASKNEMEFRKRAEP